MCDPSQRLTQTPHQLSHQITPFHVDQTILFRAGMCGGGGGCLDKRLAVSSVYHLVCRRAVSADCNLSALRKVSHTEKMVFRLEALFPKGDTDDP